MKYDLIMRSVFLCLWVILWYSCNITRHVPEGDALFIGDEVEVECDAPIPEKSDLLFALNDVTGPAPNATFLGMKHRLWIYNITGGPETKGLRKRIQNRFGEPPVLLSQVRPDRVTQLLENRVFNYGHFEYDVEYRVEEKKRKAKIYYYARVSPPYVLRSIRFPTGISALETFIRETEEESLLKPGQTYRLDRLRNERTRIDESLKNNGFYYFTPDYLIFRADTAVGSREIDLLLSVKPETPVQARTRYFLRNVTYEIESDDGIARDSVNVFGTNFIMPYRSYRYSLFFRSTFLAPNFPYSLENQRKTIGRFMGLGAFTFANVRYHEVPDETGMLDARVIITPQQKRSMRLEMQGVSKSNSFIGPTFTARFINRNTFRGAEVLSINLLGGYETQFIGGRQTGLTSYEAGVEAHLEVPRFMTPIITIQPRSRFVPRTSYRLGVRHLNRAGYFALNAFNASAGYHWRQTEKLDFRINPLNVNYLILARQDSAFIQLMDENPFFRRSFEQQFIIGGIFTATYNTKLASDDFTTVRRPTQRHGFYQWNVDVSGNVVNGLHRLIIRDAEEPRTLLGAAYAQYARTELDIRQYLYFRHGSSLAARLLTGVGMPYGNSEAMPYVKQFFIGGPNSIRAFRARTLGPGAYKPEDDTAFFFPNQVGDIKLELNLEYRFPLAGILKGAAFSDAGNIWLFSEDADRPGGAFHPGSFIDQIAVGGGIGLRLDISFFVLRLDVGIPFRVPHRGTWVFDEINFASRDWRQSNIVYNLAIGYPF